MLINNKRNGNKTLSMKTVIVYASVHHKNTEKIAQAMAEELEAELIDFSQVDSDKQKKIYRADLVGFGSGVYFGTFHRGLVNLIEFWPPAEGRRAFIFSTSGIVRWPILNRAHSHIEKKLKYHGWQVIDEFDCRGYDNYGILKLIGGIHKGRPNEKDEQRARRFTRGLKKHLEKV